MKNILSQLFEYQELGYLGARQVLLDIAEEKYNEAQVAAFLTAFCMRPVTVQELQGFRSALLDLCLPADLGGMDTIDLCGTGGDGRNTFNVSTLTAFVVAGAGYKVSKHGNYGVSSICGSSNVMAELGYRFSTDSGELQRQLESANICFLHAPLFHPAMKFAAPVRRALGFKTFFNMLGPLVNPARPRYQLVGVFNLELARLYKYILQQGQQEFTIVHSLDGYDEVSLTGPFRRITREEDGIVSETEFVANALAPEALHGGETIEAAARIFLRILNGEGTEAQNAVVLANAALAIRTVAGCSLAEAHERAQAALVGKKALQSFQNLIQSSQIA